MQDIFDKIHKRFADRRMRRSPPVPAAVRKGVPTLVKGVRRAETLMLKERFDFAGRVEDMPPGVNWLGLEDMEDLWVDPPHELLEVVAMRRETRPQEAIANVPAERLSLFAAREEEPQEVYLVWSELSAEFREPQVIAYHNNYERRFSTLHEYLRWLCGEHPVA